MMVALISVLKQGHIDYSAVFVQASCGKIMFAVLYSFVTVLHNGQSETDWTAVFTSGVLS